jgi:hypothetical protein
MWMNNGGMILNRKKESFAGRRASHKKTRFQQLNETGFLWSGRGNVMRAETIS